MSREQMWNIKEATLAADILDEVGEFDQASLVDEYIQAVATHNLVVQAGLWEKFKGWAKSKLFSEYNELVTKAREAQEAINANMKEIEEGYKKAQSDLKNYRLNEWRIELYKVRQKAIEVNRLVSGFDQAYGRFLSTVVGVQKLNPSDKEVDMATAIFDGQSNNGLVDAVRDAGAQAEVSETDWGKRLRQFPLDLQNEFAVRGAPSVRVSFNGDLKIFKGSPSESNLHHWTIMPKGKQGIRVFNKDGKGIKPKWMEETMGDKPWKFVKEDDNWIYLTPADMDEVGEVGKVQEPSSTETKPAIAPTSGKGFEVKPAPLPEEVPAETSEGEFEAVPEPAAQPTATETSLPIATPTKPASRRKMKRRERGEIPVRPKGGGRVQYVKQETYEANKDKYDLVGEGTTERIARLMELLIVEG